MVGRKASAPQAAAPSFLIFTAGPGGGAFGVFRPFFGLKTATVRGVGAGGRLRRPGLFWPFGLPFFGLFGQNWGKFGGHLPRSLGTFFGAIFGRLSYDFWAILAKFRRAPKKLRFGPFLARRSFLGMVGGRLFGLSAFGRHRLDVSCFGPKKCWQFPLFWPKHDTSRLSAFFWVKKSTKLPEAR